MQSTIEKIKEIVTEALAALGIDELGLDFIDHLILSCIIESFDGGPVGIDSLAATIGEESQTIEDVYEPYLLQRKLIKRTQRGRVVSDEGYVHYKNIIKPLSNK